MAAPAIGLSGSLLPVYRLYLVLSYGVPELREREPVAGRRFVSAFAGQRSAAAPEPLSDGDGGGGRQRDGECYEEAAEVSEVERAELCRCDRG